MGHIKSKILKIWRTKLKIYTFISKFILIKKWKNGVTYSFFTCSTKSKNSKSNTFSSLSFIRKYVTFFYSYICLCTYVRKYSYRNLLAQNNAICLHAICVQLQLKMQTSPKGIRIFHTPKGIQFSHSFYTSSNQLKI